MSYGPLHTLRYLYKGETIARILMNVALSEETISGQVIDIGGGRDPDYFEYLVHNNVVSVEPVDGSLSGINFETDPLPYADGSVDTVLLCNVLEHVYNHQFLLEQTRRVLRSEGSLVGFVPFWVGYHPDPRDYFRYTSAALEKMLLQVGFSSVKVRSVGGSPVLANFNTIVLSLPRLLRPVAYLWYGLLDKLFLTLRPGSTKRFPLGFIFTGVKK